MCTVYALSACMKHCIQQYNLLDLTFHFQYDGWARSNFKHILLSHHLISLLNAKTFLHKLGHKNAKHSFLFLRWKMDATCWIKSKGSKICLVSMTLLAQVCRRHSYTIWTQKHFYHWWSLKITSVFCNICKISWYSSRCFTCFQFSDASESFGTVHILVVPSGLSVAPV